MPSESASIHFRMPQVKVCGLCDTEAVNAALDAGADGLGFVVYERSPRTTTAEGIRRMLDALGPSGPSKSKRAFTSIAVLVDTTPAEAQALLAESGVDALQLCGNEDPEAWSEFQAPLLRRIGVDENALHELERWTSIADGFVLDHPSSVGGSGRRVDTEIAAELSKRAPCLLAGGLDQENVTNAVLQVRPHGVDASSRLELSPGRKDLTAVRRFVECALAALQSSASLTQDSEANRSRHA